MTSPAIGLYATWGPIEATAGPVAPLVFLAALIITLPTVLSYASLNRHAPSAGAAAAWLWVTVSPTTGLLAGLVMIAYFVMTAISVPLLFALFFRDLVEWAQVKIPDTSVLVAGLVLQSTLIAWVCLRGAEASIKTTIRLMLIESGVVTALSATILWVNAGHAGAINLGPFNPAHATHGLPGFWAAIILAMLAFSGFDVVTTAAEEAQAPRQHVPRVLIVYTGVNVANLVYFRRIAPAHFNFVHNLLVPVAGICLNLYLIYAAFFSALWAAPFRTGRSVVVICLALLALLLLSASCMRLLRRELLTGPAPISVDTTATEGG